MGMEEMKWKMIEQAEEELQRLESEHPHNFHVLKMELKSLISHFFHDSISLSHHHLMHGVDGGDSGGDAASASTATTQGSTCRKRKRVVFKKQIPSGIEEVDQKPGCYNNMGEWQMKKKKKSLDDRVEAVLYRAKLCLHKLHAFKTSLN